MLAVFLDIETTGLDPIRHRSIDIAFKIFDMTSMRFVADYRRLVKISPEEWAMHDPKSLKINGYDWETIQEGKEPKEVADEIIAVFKEHDIHRQKAVFICQNPAFDRTFLTQLIPIATQEKLQWPYHWLDLASMHWALLVEKSIKEGKQFPEEMTLSKNEIAEIFGLPPEEHPHRAMNGVNHLIECYQALFESVKNSESAAG